MFVRVLAFFFFCSTYVIGGNLICSGHRPEKSLMLFHLYREKSMQGAFIKGLGYQMILYSKVKSGQEQIVAQMADY